jgi:hypothetical protein
VTSGRRFDVVVVGGGPGGSSAAIACAEAGFQVAILERERFPRDLPGETLHPGVEPLLRRLGVLEKVLAASFIRHEGHWVRWGYEEEAPSSARWMPFGGDPEASPPWRGFQAWRADFDALLLQRARDAGATVYQACRAVDLLRGKSGRVAGVVTSPKRMGIQGATGTKLRAHFVVDVAGGRHWLARRHALTIERHSPRLIARYGYVDGACPGRDEALSLVADPDGWSWTARVRPRRYAWTRLSLRDSKGKRYLLPPEEWRGDGLRPWGKVRYCLRVFYSLDAGAKDLRPEAIERAGIAVERSQRSYVIVFLAFGQVAQVSVRLRGFEYGDSRSQAIEQALAIGYVGIPKALVVAHRPLGHLRKGFELDHSFLCLMDPMPELDVSCAGDPGRISVFQSFRDLFDLTHYLCQGFTL